MVCPYRPIASDKSMFIGEALLRLRISFAAVLAGRVSAQRRSRQRGDLYEVDWNELGWHLLSTVLGMRESDVCLTLPAPYWRPPPPPHPHQPANCSSCRYDDELLSRRPQDFLFFRRVTVQIATRVSQEIDWLSLKGPFTHTQEVFYQRNEATRNAETRSACVTGP